MSALSTLEATLAAENAPIIAAAPTTVKKNRTPRKTQNAATVPPTTPLSTATNVQNGVATPATPLTVPGFKIAWSTDALDAATVKAIADYKGTNVWYPVIVAIAARKAGHCTITLEDGHKGSPLGTIKSARNSAMGRVKNAGKIDVRSHATEKGVWFIIREP